MRNDRAYSIALGLGRLKLDVLGQRAASSQEWTEDSLVALGLNMQALSQGRGLDPKPLSITQRLSALGNVLAV